MAQLLDLPFALQEGAAGATQNSQERLVNMYAEVVQRPNGESTIIRRQRPGLVSRLALLGEKRCIERHKTNHYIIAGATLYRFNGSELTTIGNIGTNTGRCSMIFNDNDQIMISDGTTLYWVAGTTLNQVSVPATDFTPGHLAYVAGYGIVVNQGTGQFFITAANDFSAIDALDFATAESSPDPLVTVFVDHNEIWLAGTRTTEVWQVTGGTDFPMTPLSNAQLERGCGAEWSYAAEDNTVFFLGDDFIVYRADGYRPARVSTHSIEDQIRELSTADKAAASAMIITWRGHKFYVLTFDDALTLALDIGTGLWWQAESFGYDYWRVMGSAGHKSDYYLTPAGICTLGEVNKDEGGIMRRGGVSAPGNAQGKRITIHAFHLDCEVGRAAMGVEPNVMMRFAKDAEQFGTVRTRSLGTTGDYRKKVVYRSLGQGRKPTIELFMTDDVEFTIHATRCEATVDAI